MERRAAERGISIRPRRIRAPVEEEPHDRLVTELDGSRQRTPAVRARVRETCRDPHRESPHPVEIAKRRRGRQIVRGAARDQQPRNLHCTRAPRRPASETPSHPCNRHPPARWPDRRRTTPDRQIDGLKVLGRVARARAQTRTVNGVYIRASIEQHGDDALCTADDGSMERCAPTAVASVDQARIIVKQSSNASQIASLGGEVNQVIAVCLVGNHTSHPLPGILQRGRHLVEASIPCGLDQRVAVNSHPIGTCTSGEQQLHCLEVTLAHGEIQRRYSCASSRSCCRRLRSAGTSPDAAALRVSHTS